MVMHENDGWRAKFEALRIWHGRANMGRLEGVEVHWAVNRARMVYGADILFEPQDGEIVFEGIVTMSAGIMRWTRRFVDADPLKAICTAYDECFLAFLDETPFT